MSMYSEMRRWVEDNYSILADMNFNGNVCDNLPQETRNAMIAASDVSIEDLQERGMSIDKDLKVSNTYVGTRTRVAVPRPKGTIGLFHTHPYGFAYPSGYDMIDSMVKNDEVMCVGATGYSGTKVACYTKKSPIWDTLRYELLWLRQGIRDFNETMRLKFIDEDEDSETYGQPLRGRKLREAMGREDVKYLNQKFAEIANKKYVDASEFGVDLLKLPEEERRTYKMQQKLVDYARRNPKDFAQVLKAWIRE